MTRGLFLVVVAAGCGGGSASGDDDDDAAPSTAPIASRCADPGPDAPVVARVDPPPTYFEDDPVQWYLPEGLRAVTFYFYGGDAITEWTGLEQTAFANQLADAGIGWIAYTKAASGRGGSWDTSPDLGANADIQRLQRLRDELIATTPLRDDTPILSSGFSDGAAMSVSFASAAEDLGWPIVAVLAHNSGAPTSELPDVPLWVTSSDNDLPNTRVAAEALAEEQAYRGFEAVYRRVVERRVTPEVFLRHPEWDPAKADELFQQAVDFGLVDDAGERLVPDDQIDAVLDAYTTSGLPGAAIGAARVRVVWATHRYSAVHTVEECEFALSALGL
jgi:hypothetical protein